MEARKTIGIVADLVEEEEETEESAEDPEPEAAAGNDIDIQDPDRDIIKLKLSLCYYICKLVIKSDSQTHSLFIHCPTHVLLQ